MNEGRRREYEAMAVPDLIEMLQRRGIEGETTGDRDELVAALLEDDRIRAGIAAPPGPDDQHAASGGAA